MGAEVRTTLQLGEQRFAGTALLEMDELLFRGETRLRIGFGDITHVSAQEGMLRVEHRDGVASFTLGAAAAKWVEKIRNPRTLADKLGVKSGMRVALIGLEDDAVREQLEARGAVLVDETVPKGTPMVLIRVTRPAELERIPKIASAIARDGAIWVVHPRGVPAVADTVIFAAARSAGLTYTKVVRFSETDTAEKLVVPRDSR
jgi:hypothetical protein